MWSLIFCSWFCPLEKICVFIWVLVYLPVNMAASKASHVTESLSLSITLLLINCFKWRGHEFTLYIFRKAFSQPRPSVIQCACQHLMALGKPLLNRSCISKSFGCREVASDIEAKPLSHWLCCVLLATMGPLTGDHLLRHPAPSLLAFVSPGLKHTLLLTTPVRIHSDLCEPAWISDFFLWLNHWLNGPWLLVAPHTCPTS